MNTMRRFHTALLGALSLGGCVAFDPALYQQNSSGVTLADRCEATASVPVVQPELSRIVQVDTTRLADQYREFSSCTGGSELPGNEGFFAVNMRVGETWHFHVDVDPANPNADPAVYVLPNCNTQSCAPTSSSDVCGAGRSEHFSFRPITNGVQLIGIDSKVSGGAVYNVTVVRPSCGNGELEHGEPCDDGRPQAGVTCSQCHKVLTASGDTEVGVANDDYVNAMVVRPASGQPTNFTAQGSIAACDTDMFNFDAVEGTAITAALAPRNGATMCPPNVSLTLLRSPSVMAPMLTQAPAAVTEATTAMGPDGCPTVTLPRATAGQTWFVQVTIRPSPTTEFPYTLTINAPAP